MRDAGAPPSCSIGAASIVSSAARTSCTIKRLARNSYSRRAKIDRAQDHAGRIALQFDIAEFPRRALLDAVAQPQELLLALGRRRSRRAFKLIHRVGGDGAGDGGPVLLHREQHDHAVEVVLLKVALGERHVGYSSIEPPAFRISSWPAED